METVSFLLTVRLLLTLAKVNWGYLQTSYSVNFRG